MPATQAAIVSGLLPVGCMPANQSESIHRATIVEPIDNAWKRQCTGDTLSIRLLVQLIKDLVLPLRPTYSSRELNHCSPFLLSPTEEWSSEEEFQFGRVERGRWGGHHFSSRKPPVAGSRVELKRGFVWKGHPPHLLGTEEMEIS